MYIHNATSVMYMHVSTSLNNAVCIHILYTCMYSLHCCELYLDGMKRNDIVLPTSVMLSSCIPMSTWAIHLALSSPHSLTGCTYTQNLLVDWSSLSMYYFDTFQAKQFQSLTVTLPVAYSQKSIPYFCVYHANEEGHNQWLKLFNFRLVSRLYYTSMYMFVDSQG